ncbi:MAG TPA: MFS transporter [Actinophytocola sp.]|jgi:DHA2 family multidrug resistance protein-like MFS transporter|uniref:MFS transporter n=1 Tax=Actinophytocola sp. TaxID=1872138 RepID=UPI002E0209C0|nr:MFS transporter [Actinophytocola sp.]
MNETTKAGRREWVGLATLMLPLLLVSMDVSVLFFAVPFINADLTPTATQQLWIFDVYGFVLAGLLITMGWLGDRIGRRRLLMIGAAGFGAASVLAAYAPSAELLILARALLGIGGATLMPSTVALIRSMFHDEKQRGVAITIWTSGLTFGVSLGPILSGLLLEHFWWGSVFLINLPAMVLLLVLAPVLIPEFRNPNPGRFDLISSVLSLAAVLPVIYAIKEIAAHGITAGRIGLAAGGLLLGLVFVRRQRRRNNPMIDLSLFRRRTFSGAMALNVVTMFGLAGFAIFTTQYLQSVLGMRPLEAALWSLLAGVGVGAAAPLVSTLAQRGVNRAHLVAASFAVAAAGLLELTSAEVDDTVLTVLIGAGLLSAGLVAAISQLAELIVGDAPAERAGTVSALMETGSEFGGALGIAVLGSIGTAVYRSEITLPAGAGDAARETLGDAAAVAAHLPGDLGGALLTAARTAFTSGMHTVALVGAAVMAVAAAAALAVKFDRKADSVVG